jgi:(1->4)-alpha-D-glucan 1-alpha-D-glucosylmutase
VRARLAALTEIPARWKTALQRWAKMNARFKTKGLPDRNTEYFLYQTMIGAWPISEERLQAYMVKAVREAKEQTTWTQQNKEFEDALQAFIAQIHTCREFLADLEVLVGRVDHPGHINSLAQTLLHYTAPGVPDTYQGGELWDYRLVDPDNRTPVDYEQRQSMLSALKAGMPVEEIMKHEDAGMPKLWVVHCTLSLRREHPQWFGEEAAYERLLVSGAKAEHAVAFMRGDRVATVVPRWPIKLGDSWAGTTISLPQGKWANLLTGDVIDGGPIRIQALLRRFPVALLIKNSE